MGHPKLLPTDWIREAWAVYEVIDRVPSAPSSSLLQSDVPTERIADDVRRRLELTQDTIGLLLTYRTFVVHKVKAKPRDGSAGMVSFTSRDPESIRLLFKFLLDAGVPYTTADHWAMNAQVKIGQILQVGHACDEWKRELPLVIASISGKSGSVQAQERAQVLRQRDTADMNALKAGMLRYRRREPWATYEEILDQLQGDEIVLRWDKKEIQWRDDDSDVQSTATTTFQNWMSGA